jgi:hypothetical protein
MVERNTMKNQVYRFSDRIQAKASWHGRFALRSALQICRQGLALALVYLMIPLGVSDVLAQAQEPPPPPPNAQTAPIPNAQVPDAQAPDMDAPVDNGGEPPQPYNALSPDQLNQMVAPIALYPDALVAQVLAASTFSAQVVEADRFLHAHPGMSPDALAQLVNGNPWDPSVKALTAFPGVLSNMDRNLEWTTQLGNAYYNQPQDVMAAVQTMRQRAYDSRNLRSTSQLAVSYAPGNIVIAPANPGFVYVPYYNPWAVYGAPLSPWGGYYVAPYPPGIAFGVGFGLGFGLGIGIGLWSHWGWGWGHWGCGWGNHAVFFNHATYISRSTTVINHGYYGRFDHNPGARAYNRNMAMHAANYNHGAGFHNAGGAYRGGAALNRGNAGNFNRGGAGARPGLANRPGAGAGHSLATQHPGNAGEHPGARPGEAHPNARPGGGNPGGAHPSGAHPGAARPAAHSGGHPAAHGGGGGHPAAHGGGGHHGGGRSGDGHGGSR